MESIFIWFNNYFVYFIFCGSVCDWGEFEEGYRVDEVGGILLVRGNGFCL